MQRTGRFSTLGAILAAASGESLEGQIRAKEGADAAREIHDHAQAGDLARTLAIVFFAALAVYVIVPWVLDRRTPAATPADAATTTTATTSPVRTAAPSWLRAVLAVAVAATAVASMVSIIDAGHSGASRAWDEYSTSDAGG